MRIPILPLILVFLFVACSPPEKNAAGRLAFVGSGSGPQQVYLGEGATFEVTVANDSVARSLGKLQFSAGGTETDAQLLDLKAGQSLTVRFYDRPAAVGSATYEVALYQGKTKLESLSFAVTVIPALTADLGWVSASVSPGKALSDTTVHVEAVVRNFGAVRAFATVEVHVISAASTDVTVARFNLPTMEAGATSPVSVDLTVLGNISGIARLVMQASAPDTDATNDTIDAGPLNIVAPDWSIALEGPINVALLSPIAVTAVVLNRTEFPLPPHSYELWQGGQDDAGILDTAYPMGTIAIPALPPGTGVVITSYHPSPHLSGLSKGTTYSIFARLQDAVDSPTDANDNNLSKTSLFVYDRLPDLAAVSITASTHQGAGGMVLNVAARFANDGSEATVVPYEIWLTGPANARLLRTQLPGSMLARTAQNLVTAVTLPGLPDGTYALRVTLDADRGIAEFKEGNNTAVDPIAVVLAPDVVADIVSFTPAAIAATGTVSVEVRWSNIGNPSAASTASLWMVSGSTEKTPEFVTTVTVPSLAYQQVQNAIFSLQPLRGKGTYTWVVSAATAQNETAWVNNRFQTAATQSVSSLLSVTSRSPIVGQSLENAAIADIDNNGADELFVGSDTGLLYAMRASDASPLWQFNFGNRFVHPPALADMNGDLVLDVVVTAGGRTDGVFAAGTLAALDGTDGTTIWLINEPAHEIFAPSAVGDLTGDGIADVVFEAGSATDGGYFAVISGGTQAEVWRVPVGAGGAVGGAVIIPDVNGDSLEDVFAAALNGGMGVFDGLQGTPQWLSASYDIDFAKSPAVGNVTGSPAPEVVVAGMVNDPLSFRVGVIAVDSATGAERWRFEHRGTSTGAPVIVDIDGDGVGEVIVPISTTDAATGVGSTKILILNGDGTPRDVVEMLGTVNGAPAFEATSNPGFWSLRVATAGSAAWVGVTTPYLSSTAAPWPQFRGNLRNTGRLGD